MRRLLLLATAVCALASTAAAQPDTLAAYFPLTVGNQWAFEQHTLGGDYQTHVRWTVVGEMVVDGQPGVQVAPNPVRGAAALDVTLPAAADVRAAVYDVTGRRVLALEAGTLAAGQHHLALDAGALAPGVYVVRVTAGDAVATTRLVRVE